jgi:hypothetical protein
LPQAIRAVRIDMRCDSQCTFFDEGLYASAINGTSHIAEVNGPYMISEAMFVNEINEYTDIRHKNDIYTCNSNIYNFSY